MTCQLQGRSFWRCKACIAIVAGLLAQASLAANAGAEDNALWGKPVVGRNADGQLEVFRIDTDGELRHRWQKEGNGDWSAWSSLGGSFFPGMAIITNTNGEMQVFAVDRVSKALACIRQKAPNSHEWFGWMNLEGAIRPPVAVRQDKNGQIEVFAAGADSNTVKHIWQSGTGWSAWADLGGELQPGLLVARNRDGRLELFGIDATNNSLVHCWQAKAGATTEWTDWTSLGGSILPGFVVAQNADGRLEVMAVAMRDGAIERICQVSAGSSTRWTSWLDFDRNVKPGIAVGQSADARLEVFAVDGRDDALLHRWQILADGSDRWSAWSSMGKLAQPYPAVEQNEDGNLEVFAADITHKGTINHRRQISKASDWLDWSSLDHSTFQYTSHTWQTGDGLPHNLVQAIAQTRDGYLWVGTLEGLARFDGMNFTTFDAKNTPEIKNSSITALCADQQGTLWIGTDGGGLVCLSGGTFSHYGKTNGLAGDILSAIYEGKDGSLWIGTTTGMSRYRNGKFSNYTKKDGLSSDIVRSIYEDRDRNLWIATGEGLNRLRGDEIMDSFTMPNGLPNDSARAICQDKGGRIWIGSNNGMLWYNSYWAGSFFAYNTRYGLSDTFVSAIREDQEGNLWVGTYSGLNRFREGRFFNELDNEDKPFDKVNTLFEDREGNLWVGSREGLIRLTPKRFFTYTKRQGLSHNNIMSVLEDRGGSLWVGTWGGGLNQLKDGRVTVYAATNGFSRDLILSSCEGRDGSLWIGADFDGGLTKLKDGKFTHYTWKDGLINAALRVIHEDRSGNLWIGTSRGLSCLQDGKFTRYTVEDHLAGDEVRDICEDHEGNLWFGTEAGLSRLENGHFTNFTTREGLSDNTITALYEDKASNLWIGTGSGGLNRYNKGRITAYTMQQGLFSDEILEILEDDQGWLWMSCSQGVFRVRKQDLDDLDQGRKQAVGSIAYGKTDGIESPQCNGMAKPAGWKSRDGRLWFSTSKGLISVDPASTRIDEVPPPVYVEEIIADKKVLVRNGPPVRNRPGPMTVDSSIHRSTATAVRIPPGRGELELHYTALSLSAAEKNRFKYRLEGIDSEWVDAGPRRTAYYNNIFPGSYRFRVMACNKDGIWNEAGASLALVLVPHYWQTWWFRFLTVLSVVGGASGTALYLTRQRMQRKLELLEQRHALEKERGRIAKDIHDDLGSSLTRIMMLGERAEEGLGKREDVEVHVRKIVDSARHTVQSLDEIVWAVNPENDTLEGLVEYISHYADEFFENTDVSCHLEMPVEMPLAIPAEVRHDLFLVVKEAFNNILKHSQASEVRVQLSGMAGAVQVVIEDNGCGFDLSRSPNGRTGNGLKNMRQRIEGLGGLFEIASTPGQGTKLKFSAKLNIKRVTS
jgi:ligand-binding sensor domain-containing protein/signal transduction histidine kinase